MQRTFEIDDWPRGSEAALRILDKLHVDYPDFKCTIFAIPSEMTDEYWRPLIGRRDWLQVGVHGFEHIKGECRTSRDIVDLTGKLNQILSQNAQPNRNWSPIFKAPWHGYNESMFAALQQMGLTACVAEYKKVPMPTPADLRVYYVEKFWKMKTLLERGQIIPMQSHVDDQQGPPGRRSGITRLLNKGSLTQGWTREDQWLFSQDAARPALIKINLGCGPQIWDGWDCLDPNMPKEPRITPWEWGSSLPYNNACADLILISHSLMYCDEAGYQAAINECARVLRPGGVLRISEDDTNQRIWKPAGTAHSTGTIRSEPKPRMIRLCMKDAGLVTWPSRPGETLSPHKDVLQGDTRGHLWRRGHKFYLEGIKQ